jgi:hypothetical protein
MTPFLQKHQSPTFPNSFAVPKGRIGLVRSGRGVSAFTKSASGKT